jgi:hypothetical protein
MDPEDTKERSFLIQVLGRMYHLRADNRTACKDWVITLNRVKEARLQQGNVKLVNRTIDLLDNEDVTPYVVVVANRERTRAVDETDQWDQLYQMPVDPSDPAYLEPKKDVAQDSNIIGRWSKNHTSLQKLGNKLVQWARSVKKYSCQEVDGRNVYLDRHAHPTSNDEKFTSSWDTKGHKNQFACSASPAHTQPPQIGKPNRSMSTASEDFRTIS